MLKLSMVVAGDELHFEGAVTVTELIALIHLFVATRVPVSSQQIDRLAANASTVDRVADTLGEVSRKLDGGSPAASS